jgi:hypothetical protein
MITQGYPLFSNGKQYKGEGIQAAGPPFLWLVDSNRYSVLGMFGNGAISSGSDKPWNMP